MYISHFNFIFTGNLLQKKWKSLKDNFIRAAKKGKSGSGACKNNYIHFNRLLFLKSSTPGKEKHSNFSEDNETEADNNDNDDNAEMPPPCKPTAKRVKSNDSDNKFIKVPEKSIEQRHTEFTELARKTQKVGDKDKLFCLSLVNEIKKIPEHRRLRAKIDMYNLIAQYQNPTTVDHSPSASNYSSENYWPSQQYPSGYGYTTSGRDIAPGTPSSVATSSDDSQLELFTDC